MSLPVLCLVAYVLVLGVLAIHGIHRLVQLRWWWRRKPVALDLSGRPHVTIQVPLFEEKHVARRVIQAVGALRWPTDRLQIQVLDDSCDTTTDIARSEVDRLRDQGLNAQLIHRDDRTGFKAGALANAWESATGEWIAVFDADFVPEPEWLEQVAPALRPDVDVVQTRWGHLNADENALTIVQSVMLDGHFAIEHAARQAAGLWFNFNGTAGLWRKAAIERAGGWKHRTLVEDLDLSYRAQLGGARFVFLSDVVAPAELPSDLDAFLVQQQRWAAGTTQTARYLLGPIWRSDASFAHKLEATSHLCANASWPFVVALALLLPGAVAGRLSGDVPSLVWIDVVLFGLALAPFGLWYTAAILHTGGRWRLVWLPVVFALGLGIAVAQTRAFFQGLLADVGPFARTPKKGETVRSTYRSPTHSGLPELLLALWTSLAFIPVWQGGDYASVPFVALFVGGFGWVGLTSLRRQSSRAKPGVSR